MLKEMIVEKGKKYSVFVTPFAVFLCMVVVAYATCGMSTAPLTAALAGGLSAVNTTAAAVGGIIAYLASGEITENAFIICGLILVTAGKWIMRDDTSPKTAAFITFVSMTFSGIVFGLVVMGDFKQTVLNMVYAVVSAVASYFISFIAEILKYPNQISADRQTLTAFAVVFVLVSALLDGISLSVFNVGIIISSVVLLCACRFFGCGGGVVCGVLTTAGVFIGQSELGLQTAFFGVAGLMAGFVSGYSRVTITAVFSGIILLGQLVTGINDLSFCVQADIIIGSVIFMLIPERIVTMGGRLCSGAVKDSSELLAKEMKFAATSISDIRKSIMDIITVFDSKQKNVDYVEKVSSRICGKCRYKLDCWEKNFESTNAAFRKLESGKRGAFPLSFDCTGKNKIAEEFEKCRNEETVSKMLMARLNESRNFLFSQMEASADIVNSLSAKINVNISKSMTSTLCRALEKYDVDFNSALVYYTAENRLIAEIFLPEKTEYDIDEMCSVLSRELSAVLEYSQPFEASGEVRLRFNRKTKYTLDYAFSQLSAAENEPSGDTFGYFTDGLGFAYAFISDGTAYRKAVQKAGTARIKL